MLDRTFDCPVAKKTVTFSVRVREVRAGFPPVRAFAGCTGLSQCGVAPADGFGSYNWSICPMHSNLNS